MKKQAVFITTTIPYVNASPHLGHVLEFVEADAFARYNRLIGNEVYFLSGTDENAIKNYVTAEKEGISVKELVDRNSAIFRNLLDFFDISIDQFIRTTEKRHFEGAQALWFQTSSDIYKKTYKGLYCIGCEQFYKKEELNEKGECFEHPGRSLELVEEENYFFRLSKYQKWLEEIIESEKINFIPKSRKNEIISFIKQGLEDFSISRPAQRTHSWGVPVPDDPTQTVYVWYDALSNYINALGYPNTEAELYKKFWDSDAKKVHFLGKGVSRFHAIYWPAILKSAGLPLPTDEFIHGYITLNGQKISKTLGNVVDPLELMKKYGVDSIRYYLLDIPPHSDGDFSDEKFKEKYQSDLANGIGNFAARVFALAGDIVLNRHQKVSGEVEQKINEAKNTTFFNFEQFKFNEALASARKLISFGDEYINRTAPWKNKNAEVIFDLIVLLDSVAVLFEPLMPQTAKKIKENIIWQGKEVKIKNKRFILFPKL